MNRICASSLQEKTWLTLLAMLLCAAGVANAAYRNVTTLLAGHPQYSTFNSLLVNSGVAAQINSLTTITVLCPPNTAMDAFMSARGNAMDRQTLFNVLSYHVLLDYQDPTKLRSLAHAGNGVIVTTLFQTTGLATGGNGNINLTGTGGGPLGQVRIPGVQTTVATNIISAIVLFPYNISVLAIDAVLIPKGSSLPVSPPVNITHLISQSGNFSHFVALLSLTGVDHVFQSHDSPPGITIFVPTDAAIESFHKVVNTLTNSQIVTLLQYHAIPAFYPAQELIAAAVPQPTLASGDNRNSFTLHTTGTQHEVTIHSGHNTAAVLANLYSSNPVSIFSIDAVLQPTEIFQISAPAPSAVSKATPPASSLAEAPAALSPAPSFESGSSPEAAPSVTAVSPASTFMSPSPSAAAQSPGAVDFP